MSERRGDPAPIKFIIFSVIFEINLMKGYLCEIMSVLEIADVIIQKKLASPQVLKSLRATNCIVSGTPCLFHKETPCLAR